MTDHLSQIKQALEAVPSGWDDLEKHWRETDGECVSIVGATLDGAKYQIMSIDTEDYSDRYADLDQRLGAYYAAASPRAIRSLIERLEAAEMDAERYRWWRDSPDSPIANEPRATDAWVDAKMAPKDTNPINAGHTSKGQP